MNRCYILILGLLLASTDASAQQLAITCKNTTPNCSYSQNGQSPVAITLVVTSGLNPVSAAVTFVADQISIAPRTTNPQGEVTVSWTGRASRAIAAKIQVTAKQGSASRTVIVTMNQAQSVFPYKKTVKVHSGDEQGQFTGWELRKQLVVQVSDAQLPLPASACNRTRVTFKAFGPDDKLESVVTAKANGTKCLASTRWIAGKQVGAQRVVVSIAGSPQAHTTFKINARKTARVFFGVTLSYWTGTVSKATIDTVRFKVPRPDPMKDSLPIFGIVGSQRDVDVGFVAAPMFGVDIPFWAFDNEFTHRLRFSLAAALPDPSTRIFVGLSVPQLFIRLPMEGTGIDLHLGWLFSRRESSELLEFCLDGAPSGSARCKKKIVKSKAWQSDGFTVIGTIDASSFASSILRALT